MPRGVRYEYPLTEKLARYNDQALIALIQSTVGVKPIAITKHFRYRKLLIFFERELHEEERKKLEEILSNPPKLYIAFIRSESEEEIKKRIAEKIGVEPSRVIISGERIVGFVFDKPVDTSRLTEDDLRVKKRVVIKPSVED